MLYNIYIYLYYILYIHNSWFHLPKKSIESVFFFNTNKILSVMQILNSFTCLVY